jgi:hypothetical protein
LALKGFLAAGVTVGAGVLDTEALAATLVVEVLVVLMVEVVVMVAAMASDSRLAATYREQMMSSNL